MDVKELIMNILYIVITGVTPVITTYLVALLNSKTKAIKDKAKTETVRNYIDLATQIVAGAVTETSQTYVDALKKNGSFDKSSQEVAFAMTKTKAKKLLNEDITKVIVEIYGDLDEWLQTAIETAVNTNR